MGSASPSKDTPKLHGDGNKTQRLTCALPLSHIPTQLWLCIYAIRIQSTTMGVNLMELQDCVPRQVLNSKNMGQVGPEEHRNRQGILTCKQSA